MKRMERSFAYRGLLTALVGAVVCVPGTIVWLWPALVGLENSRNVGPMIIKVSLGAGLVLVLTGLAYTLWCTAKWMLWRRAKAGGHSVQARVLCVEKDYTRTARGKPAYVLRCMYTDEKGKKHLFRSPPLRRDPTRRLQGTVTVWCDEKDYTRHYVDVAASLRPFKLPGGKGEKAGKQN